MIKGLQTLTLLDYPGKVACTVFTGGCNFRCPFCHNGGIVLNPAQEPGIPEEKVFDLLKKRKGVLEGVCITGGEPTLWKGLWDFAKEIKAMGYAVKLDTNGTNPELMHKLILAGVVDYVAMDIKNSPDKYAQTVGVKGFDLQPVKDSVRLLLQGTVGYEFRTTVVKGMHTPQDIVDIGKWIQGAQKYFIQPYRDSELVIDRSCERHSDEELQALLAAAREYVPAAEIRG
ncbi:MAG: anaerobic ribonucleoside-triphosphate reductase activating protein [Clostridia bacterium]|nr:anaerobic ribonucleoside-triphosphate reductase activating protein [Clostridia bacterium]